MAKCKACNNVCTKKSPGIRCAGFCGETFHANSSCCDVSKNQLGLISGLPGNRWECAACRPRSDTRSIQTRSRNNHSQQALSIPSAMSVDAVSQRQHTESDDEVSDGEIDGNRNHDNFGTADAKLILSEIKELRKCVEFCSNKISDFESKLNKLNEYYKTTETLKLENTKIKSDLHNLQLKVNELEQFNRANNVEIHNVPEQKDENLLTLFNKISNFLQFPYEDDKIDSIFRTQTVNKDKPKNIVVRFASKHTRDTFLVAAKKMRKNHKNGFKVDNLSENIYINEHLPQHVKILLRDVRQKSKAENICKFVWVQNGNILARKNETSKIKHITKLSDLNGI